MKVLYDMDGVLVNLAAEVVTAALDMMRQAGHEDGVIAVSDFDAWDAIETKIWQETGSKELARNVNDLWFSPEVQRRALPYDLVIPATLALKELGIEQLLATSRLSRSHWTTQDWIDEHLPWLSRSLYWNDDGDGREHKLKLAEQHDVSLFFEDDPEVFMLARRSFPRLLPRMRLVVQPWNRQFRDFDVNRVDGWSGIMEEIMAILKNEAFYKRLAVVNVAQY